MKDGVIVIRFINTYPFEGQVNAQLKMNTDQKVGDSFLQEA